MTRVLLISNTLQGGAGKACYRLFCALERRSDVDVKLLFLYGESPANPNIISFYDKKRELFLRQILFEPTRYLRDLFSFRVNGKYISPRSVHKLHRHPLVRWAEVINLHWVPNFVDYRTFFYVIKTPVVWTLHDMLPFSGGYHYTMEIFSRDELIERKISMFKKSQVENSRISIVSPSKWLLKHSKESLPFKTKKHYHIHNTLNLNVFQNLSRAFSRQCLGLPRDGKIIVFSADNINNERKGMRILLEALQHIESNNCTLVSIGRGAIPHSGMTNYRHLGQLRDEFSLALLYSAADVSVVPSIEDNSPNTVVESLACGCPVVAFNIGGISEFVDDAYNGVLVQYINGQELALGIMKALGKQFSPEAIREKFIITLGNIAQQYCSVYNELLRSR